MKSNDRGLCGPGHQASPPSAADLFAAVELKIVRNPDLVKDTIAIVRVDGAALPRAPAFARLLPVHDYQVLASQMDDAIEAELRTQHSLVREHREIVQRIESKAVAQGATWNSIENAISFNKPKGVG